MSLPLPNSVADDNPPGREAIWFQTATNMFWFVWFRLYSPIEPFRSRSSACAGDGREAIPAATRWALVR